MKVNKIVPTKKENLIVIQFTEQEFADLHSALGMAVQMADREHRDSPQFRRALHKLNRNWLTSLKDARNRFKQQIENEWEVLP